MQNSWIKSLFAVQGKYVYLQKKLNLKSIRLSYLSRGTNIHYTFVILSLSDLDMTLKQKEMMKKTKKIKFSGLHYLTWDIQEKNLKKTCLKNVQKCKQERFIFQRVRNKNILQYFAPPKTLFPHSKNQILIIS